MSRFQRTETPEPTQQRGTCLAHGCPMPGTLSAGTTGGSEWFCGCHFGVPSSSWQAITARLRDRMAVVDSLIRAMQIDPYTFETGRYAMAQERMNRIGRPDLAPQTRVETRKRYDRKTGKVVDVEVRVDETKQLRMWTERLYQTLIRECAAGDVPTLEVSPPPIAANSAPIQPYNFSEAVA